MVTFRALITVLLLHQVTSKSSNATVRNEVPRQHSRGAIKDHYQSNDHMNVTSYQYQDQLEVGAKKRNEFGPGGISSPESFTEAVLSAHNEYRQMHHSPHLDLDGQLNKQAQDFAKELSVLGFERIRHSPGYNHGKYGENIYASCGSHVFPIDPVKGWYSQVCGYDFLTHKQKRNDMHIDDFTQLVWRGTKRLGVGRAVGLSALKPCTYIVAQYIPASNPIAHRNNVDIGHFNKQICRRDLGYVGFGAIG